MSARFSQASEDSTSASSGPGCEPFGKSRSIPSADESLSGTSPAPDATPMSDQLTLANSPTPRSSVVASRVKTSVRLAVVPGLQASNQDYGRSSPESFAEYDPDTSSWRTSQDSLFEESTPFSQTWPMSGMTRNGTAYRQRPSALPTYEHESFFWPTPVADDTGHRKNPFSQGGVSLSHVLGGRANPDWIDWLMGFPVRWSSPDAPAAMPSGTPSSRKSQSGSGDE
jgi:hypothetical protein